MSKIKDKLLRFFSCSVDVSETEKENRPSIQRFTKDKSSSSSKRRKRGLRFKLRRSSKSKSNTKSKSKSKSRENEPSISSMQRPSAQKLIDQLDPSQAAVFEQIIKVPLLKLFPVKLKTEIAQKMAFNTYKKGDIIIREESPAQDFFILIEGACDVYYMDNFVNTLRKYDYCGEQAFLSAKSQCVHHTTVKASTDEVLVLQLKERDFEILRKGPIFFIQRKMDHSIQPEYLYRDSWFENESMLKSDDDLNSEMSLWTLNHANVQGQRTDDINLEILDKYDECEYSINHLIQSKSGAKTIISNWIETRLKGHILFQFLFQSQLSIVAKCFREISLKAMEFIQKSDNQSLYLIGKGTVREWEGDKVKETFSRGDFFGSENIIFDYATAAKHQRSKPGTQQQTDDATDNDTNVVLQTVSDTVVYELDRLTYKRLMAKLRRVNRKKIMNFIRQIPLFASLLSYEIELLANTMVIREYSSGQALTLKGEECPFWFLIMTGTAYVSEQRPNVYCDDDRLSEDTEYNSPNTPNSSDISSDASQPTIAEILHQNTVDTKLKVFFKSHKYRKKKKIGTKRVLFSAKDYFGETELIYNTSCRKTIVAETDVCCLCICADEFKYVLGPLEGILNRGIPAEILHEEQEQDLEGIDDSKDRMKFKSSLEKNSKFSMLKWGLSDFKHGPFIGRGKFAQVRLVLHKKTNKLYALKSVHKSFVFSKSGRIKKYCLKVLFNERDGLRECTIIGEDLYNNFITKLFGTFKDDKFVYLLLECGAAGDFGSYLNFNGHFSEEHCRFYSACLISAVYHIHRLNLVHRDIKPENLVLTSDGYLKLTDFGFVKKLRKGKQTYTLCGTIGYIAPEIILEKGYSKTVDWFAVGCFLFHCLTGSPPFPSREQQFNALKDWCQNNINGVGIEGVPMVNIPKYLSTSVIDLLHKFLEYKPVRRWCYDLDHDIIKVKKHKWFKQSDFNWDELLNGTMKAPKIFPINPKKPFDIKHFSKHKLIKSKTQKFKPFKINQEFQNWDKDF